MRCVQRAILLRCCLGIFMNEPSSTELPRTLERPPLTRARALAPSIYIYFHRVIQHHLTVVCVVVCPSFGVCVCVYIVVFYAECDV